jgi:hypothetical protein
MNEEVVAAPGAIVTIGAEGDGVLRGTSAQVHHAARRAYFHVAPIAVAGRYPVGIFSISNSEPVLISPPSATMKLSLTTSAPAGSWPDRSNRPQDRPDSV